MNIIIGLSGKPKSGKDTVADYLVEHYGFKKYSFASYLKWLCHEYFDYDKEVLWGKKTEDSRKFLQSLGKLITDIDTNFFVDKVKEKIKEDLANVSTKKVVITDVRRLDEISLFNRSKSHFIQVDAILESGLSVSNMFDKMLVVRIERDVEKLVDSEPGLSNNINHPVEQLEKSFSNWDYYIDNNNSIKDLTRNIDIMMAGLEEE